ncbi:MAG: cytochrome c biogenesis protein ResB [Pseudomonadota bacterium]
MRKLASTRLTLLGMALFGAAVLLTYRDQEASPWWMAVPLALLAANLFAAVATDPRINRRGGLLVFHLALLALILLAGVGRLTHFSGRVEITEGSLFQPVGVETLRKGAWHPDRFDQVKFAQGPFTVQYQPGLKRAHTRSQVFILDGAGGQTPMVVGDQMALVLAGYRFYTTSNKGFAPLLTWMPDAGVPVSGAIHMPSYPFLEWNQFTDWATPDGEKVQLHLDVERPSDNEAAWTLDPKNIPATLVVKSAGGNAVLHPGETVRLAHGVLRFDELRGWMGYQIFFDPTLPWLFWIALVGVAGLAHHAWRKFARERG